MEKHTVVAVDSAKAVFEVVVSKEPGRVSDRRRLSRGAVLVFLAQVPQATVVTEACGSAHYWGRRIQELGHLVVLLPPHQVRPYVSGNKTDRTDPKGILEAYRNADIGPSKPGPEVIAPADIPMRADADERFAQDVIQRSKGKDSTERLDKRLTELSESVLQESRRFKRDELNQLSIMRLESLERHWGFFEKQLDKWRRELKASGSQYTDDAAELARRRAYWEATRGNSEFATMAPALADRVNSVLRVIGDAERAVSVPIGRQVRLGQRANSLETSIQAGQKAVAAAITYNDYRLTQVDSPPLWDLLGEPAQQDGGFLKNSPWILVTMIKSAPYLKIPRIFKNELFVITIFSVIVGIAVTAKIANTLVKPH